MKILTVVTAVFAVTGFLVPLAQVRAQTSASYLVQLKPGMDGTALNSLGGYVSRVFQFSEHPEFRNIYRFESNLGLAELKQQLAEYSYYIQRDNAFSAADLVLNDPGFTNNPKDIDKEWGLVKAGFTQVWNKSVGSKSNVIAVIDTGIDATHEDLQNINFVDGFDFVHNQAISSMVNTDDNGHGTLIAGILGATPNNAKGIVGANWDVSIMPIKALDASGKGDSSTIAQAITWAADHGANIINLSLGGVGFGHDVTLANSIRYAFNRNIVIVAAAGNDVAATGVNLDVEAVFPVCNDNGQNMIIGVAASDQNDLKAAFSNYGRNCIDVTAPGRRILSTINYDPVTSTRAPNSYAYASGTSLAAPFVSAQAAILKALYPNATNIEIRDRILSTADSIDSLNLAQCAGATCAGMLGSGRINIVKAAEQELGSTVQEGDLVKTIESSVIYQIIGGQKRIVSPFVYNQRYLNNPVKNVGSDVLARYPAGPYAMPVEGTLVKTNSDGTVYAIMQGLKLPVTLQVFQQRGYSFGQVSTVSYSELASWPTGNFLPPIDGTLVKVGRSPVVYWVVGGLHHPVNRNFYFERGLNVFPIMYMSQQDFNGYSKGEAYIR